MIVRKSFQYRLRVTKKQAKTLQTILDECRWLYNELLSQRKLLHEELEISLTKYQQLMILPEMKTERPTLKTLHSQVLQNVVDRLDKAFQAFFRRSKDKTGAGFPRYRGIYRYNSFCYPQSGFAVTGNTLKLSKVGNLRIKMHRPIEGEVKTCTLRKTSSGKWNVTLSCELEMTPLPPNEKAIGIDVGLKLFAVLSNGEEIANPRYFKQREKALAKAQKKQSKTAKGTRERKTRNKIIAKIHEKISNQRKDFCHKISRSIVNNYQYICLEDLNIKKMIEGTSFAKSIADAGWNQFRQYLNYKAEEAGRKIGWANPAYTTQTCSKCKEVKEKKLSEREHRCNSCGYQTSRDFNASRNILALGLDGLGVISRSPHL